MFRKMKERTEKRLEVVAMLISTLIGIVATLFVQHLVAGRIVANRGADRLGGEMFLYILLFTAVSYLCFPVVETVVNWIDERRKW